MSEIKDKKIKIYYIESTRDLFGHEVKKKVYIHTKKGLWAYAREFSIKEKMAAKTSGSTQTTVFKINYNAKVTADMYVEFAGETYKVESVDGYEYYKRDLIINVCRCVPETVEGEEYDES